MRRTATIIGDTSAFHLGSRVNYAKFSALAAEKYDVLQHIPYDAFGTKFIGYHEFRKKLEASCWLKGCLESDVFIVHGEGLTERRDDYVYPYLYFSRLGKELGKESQLVNFCMYEGKPFAGFLADFDYMACRDRLTREHLEGLGFRPELSFDCCVLGGGIRAHLESDGTVSAIRGRHKPAAAVMAKFNAVKYNCAWQWDSKGAVSCGSLEEYLDRISRSSFAISTSFHGNIFAYLAGIPFVSLDRGNRKYESVEIDVLPEEWRNISPERCAVMAAGGRGELRGHFMRTYPSLVKRAMLNVR